MTYLLILLSAWADRVRGGGHDPHIKTWVGKVLAGAIIAALVIPSTWWLYPACIAAYWVGEIPGWGPRLGWVLFRTRDPNDKRWDSWWTVEDSHVSLAIRGAIWGAPFLPLAYWFPVFWWAVPIFAASMLAAPVICRAVGLQGQAAWTGQEYLRGAMVAAGFAIV